MTCDVCGSTTGPFHAVVFERDAATTQGRVCAACNEDLAAFNQDPTEIARAVGLPTRLPEPTPSPCHSAPFRHSEGTEESLGTHNDGEIPRASE